MQGYGKNIAIRRGQRFGEISGNACAVDANVVFSLAFVRRQHNYVSCFLILYAFSSFCSLGITGKIETEIADLENYNKSCSVDCRIQ